MQEITLTNLYDMWIKFCNHKKIFFKSNYKKRKLKLPTFGEYHSWILKQGKYRITE